MLPEGSPSGTYLFLCFQHVNQEENSDIDSSRSSYGEKRKIITLGVEYLRGGPLEQYDVGQLVAFFIAGTERDNSIMSFFVFIFHIRSWFHTERKRGDISVTCCIDKVIQYYDLSAKI